MQLCGLLKEFNTLTVTKAMILTGLVFVLLVTSFFVILNKHQSRSLFIQIQKHEKMLDDFEVVWKQLQLELNTLTEESGIESIALTELKLKMPDRKNVIYLKP